jgi:glycine/sarcosine/betaine reductase selenoprotein B
VIEYIPRSRAYYSAQGYASYQWAHFDDVPFCMPTKPLTESSLVLITTAAPVKPNAGEQGANAPYNAAAKFFEVFTQPLVPTPDLRISHIGYDRKHCDARDPNTWLPVNALKSAHDQGLIGRLAPQLIGVPTNRSQRVTVEKDAPAALQACQQLAAEVALLVPT